MIPSAMNAASSSNVGTTKTDSSALRLVNKRIQVLRKKHNVILQKENSLDKKRRKVSRSKYRVLGQIKELEKLSKDIVSLQNCKGYLPFNSQMVNVNVSPSEVDTEESDETDSAARGAKRRRGVDEDIKLVDLEPIDKQRYLCVSNGLVIFCLDLKQNKYQSFSNACDVPPLPKIATLNCLEDPISLGLFKIGTDAYVIGGEVPGVLLVDPNPSWDEKHMLSSRVTCRLSLVGGKLSLSKCNIGKLKGPKFWPIVDKIDGQIHVFDTVPLEMVDDVSDWIFSHEVLTLDDHWIKIPTISDRDKDYIFFGRECADCKRSHTVIGDCIYAVAGGGFLLFDSKTKKWVAHPRYYWRDPTSVRQVWDILDLGIARCAGEFPHKEPTEPLYVLIAAMDNGPNDGVIALAYLVTATGQVLCFQPLPHIFGEPLQPFFMIKGTIINVDEAGRTMCAIIGGTVLDDDSDTEYLFICTFTGKLLTVASRMVRRHIWSNSSEDGPSELEFVHVEHKDRYAYKTDGNPYDLRRRLLPVQACFL